MANNFNTNTDNNDEWLTPKNITDFFNFDLDPCSPIIRPWDTAKKHYTIEDEGLHKEWEGRVFCNPPYGKETQKWLDKCADYGNAIGLVFARTETRMFFSSVWEKADAIFFIKGRLSFYDVEGNKGGTAGAPSVLIAYGAENVEFLRNINLNGCFVDLSERKINKLVK